MLHSSLVVNTVNYMKVLHDLSRAGKVRALNEKPHQQLLRTEISALHCYSQFSLADFVVASQNQQVKLNQRAELFLTVLAVLHHRAALAAHTWPSCSVRISQETSFSKGLSVCGGDTVLQHHVLGLLEGFGDVHAQSSIFTQVAEDQNTVKLQSQNHQLQTRSFRVQIFLSLKISSIFFLQKKKMTFTMSLETNVKKYYFIPVSY